MADLCEYAGRPLAFILRYVRRRPIAHTAILTAVLTAVACSVGTQYGVKFLVDVLSNHNGAGVWIAFGLLGSLIAADNLLWRLAGWIANYAFVGVTGDLRRDLFRHLTGHSQSYFAERMPGTLTSRVTATSNAVFTGENMFVWNVLPPCAATVAAIALVFTVSLPMAVGLSLVAGVMVVIMFRLAAGRPPAAPRLRQQGRSRRRRNDRHRHQYAAGAGVRRLPARAPPFRCDRRARNGGASAQPVLSREAAHLSRRRHHYSGAQPARLGRSCCGSAAQRPPATWC